MPFLQSLTSNLRKHRKPLITVLAVALLGAAVFVSVVRGPGNRFEHDAWLEAGSMEGEIKCLRGRMAKDLREHVLRTGMGRQAIIDLLGEPYASHGDELAYGLGFCSGPSQTSSLIIHLDRNGALTHTSLVGL